MYIPTYSPLISVRGHLQDSLPTPCQGWAWFRVSTESSCLVPCGYLSTNPWQHSTVRSSIYGIHDTDTLKVTTCTQCQAMQQGCRLCRYRSHWWRLHLCTCLCRTRHRCLWCLRHGVRQAVCQYPGRLDQWTWGTQLISQQCYRSRTK